VYINQIQRVRIRFTILAKGCLSSEIQEIIKIIQSYEGEVCVQSPYLVRLVEEMVRLIEEVKSDGVVRLEVWLDLGVV
jgi:soluble P-type ATPase